MPIEKVNITNTFQGNAIKNTGAPQKENVSASNENKQSSRVRLPAHH